MNIKPQMLNFAGWSVAAAFGISAVVAQGSDSAVQANFYQRSQELAAQRPELPDVYHRITKNRYFEVITEDYDSLLAMVQIAQAMGELGTSYYAVSNRILPIVVQLRPPSALKFQGNYRIRPQANGEITVDIKWSESTALEGVSQALASAFLNRVAIAHFGIAATAHIPDWLELAFSELLLTRLRPAYIDHQRDFALREPMLSAEQILVAQAPFGAGQARLANNAYYFFRNLEYELKRQGLRPVLLELLAGGQPWDILRKVLPAALQNRKAFELWWAVGFQNDVRSRQGSFYTMRESRDWIEYFAELTLELDGAPHRLRSTELWAMRQVAGMNQLLLQRVREIKLQMQKVNPVYFNALLTLGLTYEALSANAQNAFMRHSRQFLDDYANAVNLESEIMLLLDY